MRDVSKEGFEYLNRFILKGFTNSTGYAWHYREHLQGDESNHYPDAIPVADVRRRLFGWSAEERPVLVEMPTGEMSIVPGHKAIVHSETGRVFRVAKSSYQIHQYPEWLAETLQEIVGVSEMQIGSAGILGGGARAFVMIQRPESVRSRSGFELQPQILAATSHDSTLATTYKMVVTFVVCDNTLAIALAERSPSYRTRHSKNSPFRLQEARDALDLLITSESEAIDFVDTLADISVSDSQWEQIVERLLPLPQETKPNIAAKIENKRSAIDDLYRTDPRCAPWAGTGLGAFQAFNTHRQHIAGPHDGRFSRNFLRLMSVVGEREDIELIDTISTVCSTGSTI